MKKTFLVLIALTFFASICFAEEPSTPPREDNSDNPTQASDDNAAPVQIPSPTVSSTQLPDNTTPVAKDKIFTSTGKIDSKSNGYSMGVANPQITVKDDNGRLTYFMIANDAAIFGKDGNPTTLDWISKEDKVTVEYITNQDGTKTAKSIKASAGW